MGSERGARVKGLVAAAVLGAVTMVAHAEPRWCSITGRGPNDNLMYPGIARKARVFGVVKARIEFLPSGQVRAIDPISGPKLLFSLMKQQMMHWSLRTGARGDEACQAIVVAAFNLDDYALWRNPEEERVDGPSVLRMVVNGESLPQDVVITLDDRVQQRASQPTR